MISQKNLPVIIDNGSGWCKAGLSGDHTPRISFPSVVAKSQTQNYLIGKKAITKENKVYPVEHGIINNWDGVTAIWNYCFNQQLKVNSSEHPCLLTELPKNPKQCREHTTEIMFQTFQVPAFYLAISSVLSLYSVGTTTGLVLDSGDGVTHAVPIYEGYTLSHAIQRSDFAGRDLIKYLKTLLAEKDLQQIQLETVKSIKQKSCYVTLDYDKQLQKFSKSKQYNKNYELPDGKTISLGNQMFKCPQALFNPHLAGKEYQSFPQLIYQSILKSDHELRKKLYSNIVLSGGTTMFHGITERLIKQIRLLTPPNQKIEFLEPKQQGLKRSDLVWVGGSILSQLSSFKNMWITKQEYQETGKRIVHRKCF